MQDTSSAKTIALVTGANKGIGLEIARSLAQRGMTVLLGARNRALGEAAAEALRAEKLDVRHIELDYLRPATLAAAAATIDRDFHRLDVLVNNAGIADKADGPASKVSPETLRHVIDTNYFGTLAVIQAMLPLMRKSAAGRIVNVSSGLGSLTHHGNPAWEFAQVKLLGYNTSKAMVNMLTVHLAAELRDTGIKVNSADPGFTATDLNDNRGYQTVQEGAEAAIRLATLPADGPTGEFHSRTGVEPW